MKLERALNWITRPYLIRFSITWRSWRATKRRCATWPLAVRAYSNWWPWRRRASSPHPTTSWRSPTCALRCRASPWRPARPSGKPDCTPCRDWASWRSCRWPTAPTPTRSTFTRASCHCCRPSATDWATSSWPDSPALTSQVPRVPQLFSDACWIIERCEHGQQMGDKDWLSRRLKLSQRPSAAQPSYILILLLGMQSLIKYLNGDCRREMMIQRWIVTVFAINCIGLNSTSDTVLDEYRTIVGNFELYTMNF